MQLSQKRTVLCYNESGYIGGLDREMANKVFHQYMHGYVLGRGEHMQPKS